MNSDGDGVNALLSDRRLHAQAIPVISFAHTAANHYLDYSSSSFSSSQQMSVLRESFKKSAGAEVLLCSFDFNTAEMIYEGSWNRVLSRRERAAAEFTTGTCNRLPYDSHSACVDSRTFSEAPSFMGGVAVVSDSGFRGCPEFRGTSVAVR